MKQIEWTPNFVEPVIRYAIMLDGVSVWETTDYLAAVAACMAYRKNHPRTNPRRVCLIEAR